MECMADTYNLEAKINKKGEKKAQTNKRKPAPNQTNRKTKLRDFRQRESTVFECSQTIFT